MDTIRKEVDTEGNIFYYNELNQLHREDGPAVELHNGYREWFFNGETHREDGPAVEYETGTREWFFNGKTHREDGPAVEYGNGDREWWIHDVEYTEEEFNNLVNSLELEND